MRIGSIAWSKKLLSTGSRDKSILQRDMRSSRNFVQKLAEHSQ
jgi:cell division cycle 20-like protein 1 (cofactor of APC complex)